MSKYDYRMILAYAVIGVVAGIALVSIYDEGVMSWWPLAVIIAVMWHNVAELCKRKG